MTSRMKWRLLLPTLLLQFPVAVQAQAPESSRQRGYDYEAMVRPKMTISPLGLDLFGDETNLYTGETKFLQVDIDVPGNNELPVRLARSLTIAHRQSPQPLPWTTLADWELELPHISGVYASPPGWVVQTPGSPNNRCSVSSTLPSNAMPTHVTVYPSPSVPFTFDSRDFWRGLSLRQQDGGNEPIMVIDPAATRPSSGGPYHWITQSRWVFSCLPATANGVAGEAFMGISPNGTKYRFDWIVSKSHGRLSANFGSGTFNYTANIGLMQFRALPTRIEDRYGNYVTLNYDISKPWHLTSIVSSDGRSIQLAYDGFGQIVSASAAGRTWIYSYSTTANSSTLVGVQNPDSSRWQFNTGSIGFTNAGWMNCADYNPFPGTPTTASSTTTFVHPSGAVGTFQFGYRIHGRSDVPKMCYSLGKNLLPRESNLMATVALINKAVSGPGIAALSWGFDYGAINATWAGTSGGSFCQTTPCATTRTLTVTSTDGSWDKYTFNQQYGRYEGKMLRHDRGVGSTVSRREDTQYRANVQIEFPKAGTDPCAYCDKASEYPTPTEATVINQDGVNFSWRATTFDSFARPTTVIRSSSPQ